MGHIGNMRQKVWTPYFLNVTWRCDGAYGCDTSAFRRCSLEAQNNELFELSRLRAEGHPEVDL